MSIKYYQLISCLLLAFCIGLSSISLANTQTHLNIISKNKIIRIGTTGDYPPLTYYNPKTKRFSGSTIKKMNAFASYLGVKAQFVKTTWSTLSNDLLHNKFDIAAGGITDTAARRKLFLTSDTVALDGKVPLVRCADKFKYNAIYKINQPSVRVVENLGGTNYKFAKKHLPKAKLIIVKKNLNVFDYLLNNQADVMITDLTEALYRHRIMPTLCVVNPNKPLTRSKKVYLLPKGSARLLKKVNAFIAIQKIK